MGIRYYAYAFDRDQTDQALKDPRTFIADDPLADAWGFQPHARAAFATFKQAVPEKDMLYLDKAWRYLQLITGPASPKGSARAAFRMFQGDVTMCDEGWVPCCRALTPAAVAEAAHDLATIDDERAAVDLAAFVPSDDEVLYALQYLGRARTFATDLAVDGRGMAYMIG